MTSLRSEEEVTMKVKVWFQKFEFPKSIRVVPVCWSSFNWQYVSASGSIFSPEMIRTDNTPTAIKLWGAIFVQRTNDLLAHELCAFNEQLPQRTAELNGAQIAFLHEKHKDGSDNLRGFQS